MKGRQVVIVCDRLYRARFWKRGEAVDEGRKDRIAGAGFAGGTRNRQGLVGTAAARGCSAA